MKTVTANRLTDGRVIYRTVSGSWSTDLAEAARAYLIELEDEKPGGQKWRREGIRLTGPTTGSTRSRALA